MKIKKITTEEKTVYNVSNGLFTLEILEFDGRILQISDQKKRYKYLSKRIFSLAARSKFPYGITSWVKTGNARDGAAGVLSENAIGYDIPLSEPVKIQKLKKKVVVWCVIEKNGVRFEKMYEIEQNKPYFIYICKLINTENRIKNLQIEHFFVWNSDDHREKIGFIVPREDGIDELGFPPYDELDCFAVRPSENWAAYINHYNKSGVIFTFSGIQYVSRYIAGDNGQCAGYSPEIMLDKNGEIVNVHRFHILPDICKKLRNDSQIECVRKKICSIPERKISVSLKENVEDRIKNLLFLPEKFIKKQGNFVLDSSVFVYPNNAEFETQLFSRQLNLEFGIKPNSSTDGKNIRIVLQPQTDVQSYRMEINPCEVIITGTKQSIVYAFQTFLDLAVKTKNRIVLPCCHVEDRPEIIKRGMLMFPSGRNWDYLTIKFAMGVLTRFRFNMFMVYLSPEKIIFEKPLMGIVPIEDAIEEKRMKIFAEELRKLHIEPLVCCETKHILCPNCQKKETEIMQMFLEKVVDIFKPEFINIGYDEMGRFNPSCQCKPDAKNHQVYVNSISFFHNILKNCGTRASIWCDMLFRKPGDSLGWLDDPVWALNNLPKDVILNDYEYMPDVTDYPRIEKWKRSGFDVICTPWAMEQNILHWINSVKKYGADGILGSSWTSGPSREKIGYVEGLVWTGILSWRGSGIEIEKMKPLVKNTAYKIAKRKWEKNS
ncbi:MAG: hypothetical protein N2115_07995 [bacterium]|nr:hypothetical protein [bacterium]